MKIVKTQNVSINSYNSLSTFNIPAFSNILNFFIEYSQIYIIYEYDDFYTENNKIVNVRIVKGLNFSEPNDFYKYWGTIKTDSSSISSNTGSVGSNSINLNIQLMNTTEYIHLFILETKPIVEVRDDKLNTLV